MSKAKSIKLAIEQKLNDATMVLKQFGFGPKQSNELAAYVLLAILDIKPLASWQEARNPLRGITPIIEFIAENYGQRYAPNTRETVRDEAVKYFVEHGLLLRNPDNPQRPTNSGKTVYQIEPTALELLRSFGLSRWRKQLDAYLAGGESIRRELHRHRELARIPVTLPDGSTVKLSPGGQNPLIKAIIEDFCPRFVSGGRVLYIGDTENKFEHLESTYLEKLGVVIDSAAKMPDVVVHAVDRNWLLLIEAVTSAGPIDGKRRAELKVLFSGSTAGLVFVTAFETRRAMQSFLSLISWETEGWVADAPDHLIHFDGERFLGPYDDVKAKPPTDSASMR